MMTSDRKRSPGFGLAGSGLRALAATAVFAALMVAPARTACAAGMPDREAAAGAPLVLGQGAVIATGNNWIALPEIRASDGAVVTFNALSMRDRGLLQVQGSSTVNSGSEEGMIPAVAPWVAVDSGPAGLQVTGWRLIDDWIPVENEIGRASCRDRGWIE